MKRRTSSYCPSSTSPICSWSRALSRSCPSSARAPDDLQVGLARELREAQVGDPPGRAEVGGQHLSVEGLQLRLRPLLARRHALGGFEFALRFPQRPARRAARRRRPPPGRRAGRRTARSTATFTASATASSDDVLALLGQHASQHASLLPSRPGRCGRGRRRRLGGCRCGLGIGTVAGGVAGARRRRRGHVAPLEDDLEQALLRWWSRSGSRRGWKPPVASSRSTKASTSSARRAEHDQRDRQPPLPVGAGADGLDADLVGQGGSRAGSAARSTRSPLVDEPVRLARRRRHRLELLAVDAAPRAIRRRRAARSPASRRRPRSEQLPVPRRRGAASSTTLKTVSAAMTSAAASEDELDQALVVERAGREVGPQHRSSGLPRADAAPRRARRPAAPPR